MDHHFDRLLAIPDDPRRRLYAAMRHAAIGGGKRLRPLLVCAACAISSMSIARRRSGWASRSNASTSIR